MANLCKVCKGEVKDKNPLSCDTCKGVIHTTCSNLTRGEIQCLQARNNKFITFNCEDCKKTDYSAIFRELKDVISILQKEIADLKEKLAKPNETTDNINTIINEITDRKRRAKNVVLYNVAESTSTNTDERIKHDDKQVERLLSQICDNAPKPIRLYRLGKRTSENTNYNRPIKAVFSSKEEAVSILKNKKNIKSDVRLSSDNTKIQREHFLKIKNEFQSRVDQGENNIGIRYVNDNPTIVNLGDSKNRRRF